MMKKLLFLVLSLCSISMVAHCDLTWSTPGPISTALTNASDPHVVIDGNGNATAVWVENSLIKSSSLPSGGSWSTPITISNASNTSSTPRIGVDGSGNVTALWLENVTSILPPVVGIASVIATKPFGGSWGTESIISGAGATTPVLAVDSSGNAIAMWARNNTIETATRLLFTGIWNSVAVLASSSASNPHVAIGSGGKAFAAWHSNATGSDVIATSQLLVSAINAWSTPLNVFPGTAAFNHNYPKVAVDANGNAVVAWIRYNLVDSIAFQNVQILASSFTAGASAWAVGTALSNNGVRNPADLSIKLRFDTSGDAIAVWTNSYDGETFTIESAQKLFAGNWPFSILTQAPSIYSFGFDLSMATGTALLTSMYWDGVSAISIQSAETDTAQPVAQAWTIPETFSTGNDNASPSCSMTLSGSTLNAVAVWLHYDGSNVVVHASSGTDSTIAPPTSVSATQSVNNFGVYNDYFNTLTWTASTDPNVIEYNLYRNGVYFASTGSSTFSFIDHNQTQGATITYGVAALTSSLRQSPIASFTLHP